MAKVNRLLIVESPAKAKTIKKFLGAGYTVKASMGHIRDIPSKGRGKKRFGIDLENNYTPQYEPIKTREKTLKDLEAAASKVDEVYLAPDPDREGEAIAWHLKEQLKLPDDKAYRVTFNAITKSAVQDAIAHPTKINMNLVNAQQGRRVLDRLVGFSLSPFLWKKITKGLSGGRVQSVAVRLVVEREKEISAFTPEEFWKIVVKLAKEGIEQEFEANLVKWDDEKFVLGSACASTEDSATKIAAALENAEYKITSIDKREVKGRPSPPFITSTLQQAASTFLYFGAQRTMRIAQQLYEGIAVEGELTGLITYMRTDSTRVAPEGIAEVRDYIKDNFSAEYLPAKANVFTSKKNAQDAHEAVRPTNTLLTPERIKNALSPEQYKLYELIWRRFVASQMAPARYQTTTATITADKGILEAKGRVVLFNGHTVLQLEADKRKKEAAEEKEGLADDDSKVKKKAKDKDQILPAIAVADLLLKKELRSTQHFTTPPPRFSEASLVRALEKEGIGRPSTYAPIVQTIQDRGYVRLEKRSFHATELGIAVTDLLLASFEDIMDLAFTAKMEGDLDKVEEGKAIWYEIVDAFFKPFTEKLEVATKEAESLKGKPAPNGEKCPLCQSDMVVRYSARGAFLGCVNYPECKGLMAMPGEEGEAEEGDFEPVSCPKCGNPMIKKRSRFGDFYACSSYPACNQTLPLGKDGKPVELPDIKMDCNKCGKEMIVKMGKNGPFLACSGYPECKTTKHLDKDGKIIDLPDLSDIKCDKCGAPMIARMSRRGPFMACSAFPKCRNAKPIPGSEQEKKQQEKEAKAAERAAKKIEREKLKAEKEAEKAAKKIAKKKTTKKKASKKKTTKKKTVKKISKKVIVNKGDEEA